MRIRVWLLAGLMVAFLPACFKKMPPASQDRTDALSIVGGNLSTERTESTRLSGGNVSDERSLIRTGTLDLRAKDLNVVKTEVEAMVRGAGGRVDSWSITDDRWLSMRLRIPEARLDEAMDRIATLGRVKSRSLQSSDVTDQVIDLEVRLTNLIALRDRLRSYLERASDLKEILEVEKELARVQTDVEIIQRQLELLKTRMALSELSLTVRK